MRRARAQLTRFRRRRRAWLWAAFGLALAGAIAASGDAGVSGRADALRIGLTTDVNDTVAARVEVRHVRQDLDWDAVQPRPGVWRWEAADFRLRAAASRRVTLLPVLLGGARWTGGWNRLPRDPSAYARWVAQVAARYGPGGTFWRLNPALPYRPVEHIELWNEPYFEFFSRDGVDPARYARLVRAAVIAGRRANPHVKYVLEADWTPGEPRRSFVEGMYAAVPDLNRYFDVIAAHPYSGERAPDRANDPSGFARLHELRARFIEHGAAGKPIWITELGWSTCPAGQRRECVSERQQSRNLRRVYELLVSEHSYVRALYFYTGRDHSSGSRTDREAWFGLFRADGSAKPGYHAVRDIARSAGS